MLQFEHINLVVSDIDKSLSFYRTAFPHWNVRGGGSREWYGKPSNWLHFGDDYQYIAFSDHGIGTNRNLKGHQLGLAHFAFVTNDIDSLAKRLSMKGFHIESEGADDAFRKNIYFIDPDGYEVEFVQYFSDSPEDRNSYE